MRAADVFISKPGGLSTSEALAAGVPIVLLRPLPGQEQRNARYLVARGAALRVTRPRDLCPAVETVLHDDGVAARVRAAGAAIAHPDAADLIADRIAALAGHAPTGETLFAAHPASSGTSGKRNRTPRKTRRRRRGEVAERLKAAVC